MTDAVADNFLHLDALSADQLHLRRETLLDTCASAGVRDYAKLSDEALSELLAINRLLRKKNSGPPKRAKSSEPASLEDLA